MKHEHFKFYDSDWSWSVPQGCIFKGMTILVDGEAKRATVSLCSSRDRFKQSKGLKECEARMADVDPREKRDEWTIRFPDILPGTRRQKFSLEAAVSIAVSWMQRECGSRDLAVLFVEDKYKQAQKDAEAARKAAHRESMAKVYLEQEFSAEAKKKRQERKEKRERETS